MIKAVGQQLLCSLGLLMQTMMMMMVMVMVMMLIIRYPHSIDVLFLLHTISNCINREERYYLPSHKQE